MPPVRRLLVLFAFLLGLAPVPSAAQQPDTSEPAPTAEPSPLKSPPPPDAVRYRLVVDAPEPPLSALRDGLDLARWQGDEEMTLDLLELLVREARPQAQEIAAIQGFYRAEVTTQIDRSADPLVVTVRVVPGPASIVRSVQIDVQGNARTDSPRGAAAIRNVEENWPLRIGEVFRQAAWQAAKEDAVRRMRRGPYAASRITQSEARVTPEESRADLSVTIESGPPFYFGGLEVRGNRRYPASLVKNFSTIERGAPYSEQELDDYIRRLAQSGYFASSQASIDPEKDPPEDATVTVSVIEGPTHRFDGSVSFSTDTEFGVRASYTNINLDDNALQMRIEARIESKEQLAGVVFTWPPTDSQWIDTVRFGGNRTELSNTVDTTAGVGWNRRKVDERNQPLFGVAYYYTKQEPEGAEETSSYATYADVGYIIRRVDNLLDPTRGWMVDVRVGAGIPGLSTEGFGRAVALSQAWYPIDRDNQLEFRAEAGGVFGASRENVPAALLFRTGGDNSVRGYAYQSLGVEVGDAVVGGRYYVLGSVEYTRWITPLWGVAAFVDAGDAADRIEDLDPAVGVGIGARLRTPVGPFRLDIAYGERTRKFRLHLSVGLSF